MIQTLRVNDIPSSLNKYRNMDYHSLDKEKKEWERVVHWLVKEQKLQPFTKPIKQTYSFWFQDKRVHDPDNYACCAKFLNDGIVKAGILQNDSFDHIVELTIKQGGISKKPYILIHMEEVND